MELRIRKPKADGNLTDIVAGTDQVSAIQMIAHTLWKNCRVSINGTQVFEGNNLMAYKSIFDYTLTYPESVKNSYLNVAGYYLDSEISQENATDPSHGIYKRNDLYKDSKVVQVMGRLNIDLANQPKYLVNQVGFDVYEKRPPKFHSVKSI